MCENRCATYELCRRNPKHLIRLEYIYCREALARQAEGNIPGVCLPPSGDTRDLGQALDVQDEDTPGECPVCEAQTPPYSSD
jgi:hypothetical protein